MSFTPNMPVTTQSLGTTQPLVLANFAALRSTISNAVQPNHVDVNSSGAGKHVFVQMPVQTASAANLPAANEGGLITQTVSGNSELFYVRDNTATYTQLTKGNTFLDVPTATGSTFLPGGLILKFGKYLTGGDGATITFPGGAFPNNCLNVQISIFS